MSQEPRERGVFPARVVSNTQLCRDHFKLVLEVRDFPPTAPGQFVQLGCRAPASSIDEPDEHAWRTPADPGLRTESLVAPVPLLRRPFSLAGDQAVAGQPGARHLEIIGRAIGTGTQRLAAMPAGAAIDLIGPLGNRFVMPAAGQTAVLVGGGVGIPPMIYLAEALARAKTPAVAVAGVTTFDFLPLTCDANIQPNAELPSMCAAEFSRHGVPTMITSDDGSVGLKGLVTVALARVLDSLNRPADGVVVYTCGPERMMRAVTELAIARGIRVWVAMERAMACGIGTCQSCVCKVRAVQDASPSTGEVPASAGGGGAGKVVSPPDWAYKLVCTDGTIFDGRSIVWE